jgi:hypothetical protein
MYGIENIDYSTFVAALMELETKGRIQPRWDRRIKIKSKSRDSSLMIMCGFKQKMITLIK